MSSYCISSFRIQRVDSGSIYPSPLGFDFKPISIFSEAYWCKSADGKNATKPEFNDYLSTICWIPFFGSATKGSLFSVI